MANVLEFQLQHHSFQRHPRADLQNGLVGSPCSPRDSQESSPTPQFKSINSSALSFLHIPTSPHIRSQLGVCVLWGGGGHTWEVSKGTHVLFWNTPSPHPASRRPNNAFPEFFIRPPIHFYCIRSTSGQEPPATAGDQRGGSIPGRGRSPGVGNGNPLQYSCLRNPADIEA